MLIYSVKGNRAHTENNKTQKETTTVPKKKINPRRIPLSKAEFNKDAIIEEAMSGTLANAWLLVASALYEQGYRNIDKLNEKISAYVDSVGGKADMKRAEELMGMPTTTRFNHGRISSPYDLEKYKQKVAWVAIRTSLGVICLGLEDTGEFTEEEIRRVFLNVDLSLAEIERGMKSYEQIERELLNRMVQEEMENAPS